MKSLNTRLGLASLLLLGCLGLAGCSPPPAESGGDEAAAVTVSKPLVKQVTDFEYFTGQTAAVDSVEVRARVSGYLDKILFTEGKEVKKDAKLFVIDPRPYKAAYDQADGKLKAAEARLRRQDADLERIARLIAQKAVSREEYDKAIGDKAETAGGIFTLQAGIEQAKLDLGFTDVISPIDGVVGRALVTKGNLVRADETTLTSVVSVDPMYVYFNVDERTVLDIQERIRKGSFRTVAEAAVPAWVSLANEGNQYPHEGKIDFINNQVNTGTGTLQVRAVFANPPGGGGLRLFTPGLFVRVKIPVSQSTKRLLVADRAIGSDLGEKFVYVVDAKNVVERRPVKVGPLEKNLRVIVPVPVVKGEKGWRPARENEKGEDSLREGERVIISGLQQVYPGVSVRANEVKMPGGDSAGL
jgi:RND family efflux transporter MFP subunit